MSVEFSDVYWFVVGFVAAWFFKDSGHKIDYGYACGRAWVEIDGKVIAQTGGDDMYLRDDDVQKLIELIKSPRKRSNDDER